MTPDKIYKTVRQYNKTSVSEADMNKLMEIAEDYSKVKNYVYQRYGGIKSIPKLYPGYTVQNEMTESGLRSQLGLPSVYFYLAVFDALADIKSQWAQTKNRVLQRIRMNPELTSEDRHYLRFVMKQSQCFESILLKKDMILMGVWKERYEELCTQVDDGRLNQYLRRQIRIHLRKLHTDVAEGFRISEKAYRYGDHGIYLSIKEKRKRIFVPLTDGNQYKKQLYIRLYPGERKLVIHVPMEVETKQNRGYHHELGLAAGFWNMFVTDSGNVYGEQYGEYQLALTEYVKEGMDRYRKNGKNNPGKKKYYAGKERLEAALHTYVNTEINRMLKTEKPGIIYIPGLPHTSKAGISKTINHSVSMWQRGYVKNRLAHKCREQSIGLVEVFGKDISKECSCCGTLGKREAGNFLCQICGLQLPEKENTARNARKRGMVFDKALSS